MLSACTLTLETSVLMAHSHHGKLRKDHMIITARSGLNTGGALMAAGYSCSDEARALCGAISAIMTGRSYATSAAGSRAGLFPLYQDNADHMLRVIYRRMPMERQKVMKI